MSAPVVNATPGWFGKLPAIGDFASRRLPDRFVAACDAWFQAGMVHGQTQLGAAWLPLYLRGPIMRFRLGPGVIDENGWQGVVMPSVDRVGRYFPLVIATPWPVAPDHAIDRRAGDDAWFAAVEDCALQVLDPGHSIQDLEADLAALELDRDRLREEQEAGPDVTPGAADPIRSDPIRSDAVPSDAAPSDAVPPDAVPSDAVPSDSVPSDAAPPDAGASDTDPTDAAPPPAGASSIDAPARPAEARRDPGSLRPAAGESLWWEEGGRAQRCAGLPSPQEFVEFFKRHAEALHGLMS